MGGKMGGEGSAGVIAAGHERHLGHESRDSLLPDFEMNGRPIFGVSRLHVPHRHVLSYQKSKTHVGSSVCVRA